MIDLEGRVALVTGSTKGIGLAVAEQFARAGASVVVSSRTVSDVEDTAARLGKDARGEVIGIPCDVRDPTGCAHLVDETVRRLGRLDILVNNAGIGIMKPVQEMSVEEWRLQIDTNLGGAFYCAKAALPHLSATGDGWIVNVGSLASRNPIAGGTGYNASKFGLLGMTEATMLDVRYDDVRVSIVMPGSVDTHFGGRQPGAEGDWRLHPEDCAKAVLQLLSYPKNAHVSRMEIRPSQPRRRGS